MQINISGHHLSLTPALKEHVTSKLSKVEKHFDHITSASVVLTIEKGLQKAEANLHVSGADIFAQAEDENMYTAIDALTTKLDRQLIKHKEKLKNHKSRNPINTQENDATDEDTQFS